MIIVDGEEMAYDGASEIELPQLTVTYALNPYTWSDGTPGTIEDVKLAYRINCDRDSGATEFNVCNAFSNEEQAMAGEYPNVTWADDGSLEWTIKFWPGVQDPTYFLIPFSVSPDAVVYPSHQAVSDGRMLADVPAAEWRTLPEIAERPLSYGPFMITDWQKGQSVTLERNPHYEGDVGVERIIVLFITDTNQAVAQLLSGDVDYVEKATLGGGAEVQTVVDAAAEGKLNVEIIPSPTWEHIDMNLYSK